MEMQSYLENLPTESKTIVSDYEIHEINGQLGFVLLTIPSFGPFCRTVDATVAAKTKRLATTLAHHGPRVVTCFVTWIVT